MDMDYADLDRLIDKLSQLREAAWQRSWLNQQIQLVEIQHEYAEKFVSETPRSCDHGIDIQYECHYCTRDYNPHLWERNLRVACDHHIGFNTTCQTCDALVMLDLAIEMIQDLE